MVCVEADAKLSRRKRDLRGWVGTTMIYARVSDSTLEANYRQAMSQFEAQHLPLSSTPIPVQDWPTSQPANLPDHYAFVKAKLDNSA
jgi:hypothetical protein